jgi:uncharacterized protein YjbJ (UPF0337 family)
MSTKRSWQFLDRNLTDMLPNLVTDLELYTTRVDAYGLLALSALLLVLADAVPLPNALVGSTLNSTFTTSPSATRTKRPYAPAIIFITILHHIFTGIGSFSHWSRPTHRTIAMDIGVWGNVGLSLLGVAALVYLNGGSELAGKVGEAINKESDKLQGQAQNLQEQAQNVIGNIREDVREATRSTRKRA